MLSDWWFDTHTGHVLTKAEKRRRVYRHRGSKEDGRRLKQLRVLRRLEDAKKVGCRHLPDVGSSCVLFNFGFCCLDCKVCDVFDDLGIVKRRVK